MNNNRHIKTISNNNIIYNYKNKNNLLYVTRQLVGKGLLLFNKHYSSVNDKMENKMSIPNKTEAGITISNKPVTKSTIPNKIEAKSTIPDEMENKGTINYNMANNNTENKGRLLNKVQDLTDACRILDKKASKKYKLSNKLRESKANNYIGKSRHFSPLNNEWFNSIYTFSTNLPKILPALNKILLRIVKSYFNFYSRKLENNIKSRRLRIKARRLSINKILTSKPQLKHTSDLIIITIYTYNRQKIYYLNKLKKIASLDVMDTFLPSFLKEKIFQSNTEDWPSNIKLKTIKNKGLDILVFNSKINQQKSNISINMNAIAQANAANNFTYTNINTDISYGKSICNEKFYSFYNNYAAKCLREEILTVYIKQLISFNKSKFDQRYIMPLVDVIKKIYNKNIQFNIVGLKYTYLNSYIFSETLLTKLKNRKNNIIKVLDKSLWLFTVPDMDKLAVYNDIYARKKRLQNLKADCFTKVEGLNLKTSNNNKILQLPFRDNSQTSRVNTINNKQSLMLNTYNNLLHVQPVLKDNDGVDSLLSAVYTSRSLDKFKNYKMSKHVDNTRKTCNGIFIESQKQAISAPESLNSISSHYTQDRQNKVFKNIKNVDVTGIRIEAAGRLTKRNTAAKSVFKLRYTGNIKDMDSSYKGLSSVTLRGFAKSNLQHTKSESYIRIGSYGIKVWISSFLYWRIYLLLTSTYLFYVYLIYSHILFVFILFINTYLYT